MAKAAQASTRCCGQVKKLEGWQTAGLNPERASVKGFGGVPLACEVGRCACGSGACWALCRQTAGCNAGTAGADGYRAWCNRPAEYWKHCKGLKAGKRQA